ncbi:MAG TPA: hypothetical protein VHV78_11820 [Gemmatimonadaceae bacterium]|jgi:hypothetical protein|nr:hypothetical protein [Gemmatimonadaceae bacterium]
MTHAESAADVDLLRARRRVEYVVAVANYTVGFLLTIGGLAVALRWRVRYGGFNGLHTFLLHEAWAFGALELVAGAAMMRRWAARWVLEMLPLGVPVIAYQYFIIHFIYRRV